MLQRLRTVLSFIRNHSLRPSVDDGKQRLIDNNRPRWIANKNDMAVILDTLVVRLPSSLKNFSEISNFVSV